jgi:16S rRNA (guanine966-N2)-methyltransferase
MARRQKPREGSHPAPGSAVGEPSLRIIGGTLGGRRLLYSGDERTRPMKDRVREAVFNLVGTAVVGSEALDLFAGTGALGLEAISRGAERATFIERHFPTAELVRKNIADLGLEDRCRLEAGDAFRWSRRHAVPSGLPWVAFCSPPFAFYVEREGEMLELIGTLLERALPDSILVVESDERFDPARLPEASRWDVREYPPARVAIIQK